MLFITPDGVSMIFMIVGGSDTMHLIVCVALASAYVQYALIPLYMGIGPSRFVFRM